MSSNYMKKAPPILRCVVLYIYRYRQREWVCVPYYCWLFYWKSYYILTVNFGTHIEMNIAVMLPLLLQVLSAVTVTKWSSSASKRKIMNHVDASCDVNQPPTNHVVFYHTKKCGGWTVHNFVAAYLHDQGNNSCMPHTDDWRCDLHLLTDTSPEQQCIAYKKFAVSQYSLSQIERPMLLRQIFPSFITFITILRDPLERVLSSYRMVHSLHGNNPHWTMMKVRYVTVICVASNVQYLVVDENPDLGGWCVCHCPGRGCDVLTVVLVIRHGPLPTHPGSGERLYDPMVLWRVEARWTGVLTATTRQRGMPPAVCDMPSIVVAD
jgi:hypothetical protein